MAAEDKIRKALTGRGPTSPDVLSAETGLSGGELVAGLGMLQIMGEVEDVGGRYVLKGEPPAKKAKKAPAKKATSTSKAPRVSVARRKAPATSAGPAPGAGTVKRKGANWTARKAGAGVGRTGGYAYPVQVCSVRYKDPKTGKWAKTPASAKHAKKEGRATAKKGTAGRLLMMRRRDADGNVLGARVIDGASRQAERRGKMTASARREAERQVSDEYAAHVGVDNHSDRMRAAYESDKAKRGASTRARNKAAGRTPKRRDPVVVRTELLKVEQRLKDAERRHQNAKTYTTRGKHMEAVKRQRLSRDRLRAELAKVGG